MGSDGLSQRIFVEQLATKLERQQKVARTSKRTPTRNEQKQTKLHEDEDQESDSVSGSGPRSHYKRCSVCPRVRDRKTKWKCSKCYRHVCKEHTIINCLNCHDKNVL